MFKFIGFGIGVVVNLILGVRDVKPRAYFFLCFFTSISVIIALIVHRLLASYYAGFWKVWMERWETFMYKAQGGLKSFSKIPEYEVESINVDLYGNRFV